MKLRQYLISLFKTIMLACTPVERLGRNAEQPMVPVIVSLTSIPSRLKIVHLVIRSLLNQSVHPEKVFLWLHTDLQSEIPESLQKLISDRFEILYSNERGPHRKLVETLRHFPDRHIVTCDDDHIYPVDWLERLQQEHQRYPDAIVAHMCRVFRYEGKELLPYRKWHGEIEGHGSPLTLALGWGGVWYPPGCLHEDVTRSDMYDELAPRADDMWFKAMSFRQGTLTRRTTIPLPEPTPVIFSQKFSLQYTNVGEDENRKQWLCLADRFQLELT
jgi:hypothetical protein